MSSYFDFFCKHIKNGVFHEKDAINGICYSMCPNEEVKLREKEHLVHTLEVVGTTKRLVKSYGRSAADSHMAKPNLLRPYSVLLDTVTYLVLTVVQRSDVPMSVIYDFVNDRLRAVRQDMTIQRLPVQQCVHLLEPMVRFYIFFGYRMSDLPLKDYDPVLNKKYLLECINWYLQCCDTIDKQQKTQESVDKLSMFLSNLDLNSNKDGNRLSCDRVLVECLYILSNLDDIYSLFRFTNLTKALKRSPTLRLSYKICIANSEGNYIKICRLLNKLCPLTYCAMRTYLPTLQRQALHVMCYGYNSTRLTVPVKTLVPWLGFRDEQELKDACTHYGLKVLGDAIQFNKSAFRKDVGLYITKEQDLKVIFDVDIENIFTYTIDK